MKWNETHFKQTRYMNYPVQNIAKDWHILLKSHWFLSVIKQYVNREGKSNELSIVDVTGLNLRYLTTVSVSDIIE